MEVSWGWQASAFGPPRDVLRLGEFPRPKPKSGEILIEVLKAPVNFPDDLIIRGSYQEKPSLPFTPGLEILGNVLTAGTGTSVSPGDRVLAYSTWPAGGFATHAVATEGDVFQVPKNVPDTDAACLLISYQTAWIALHHRAMLRDGELVLVHAGAGASGSAAIQVAKAAGAVVIATAGSEEKVETCRTLGAQVALSHRHDNVVDIVKEFTNGRGVDVVFDGVGGGMFDLSRRCVAWEGRILVIGFAAGTIQMIPANHPLLKNYAVVGVHAGSYRTKGQGVMRQAQEEIFRLYEESGLRPLVGNVVQLRDGVEAIEAVVSGETRGKSLLDVSVNGLGP